MTWRSGCWRRLSGRHATRHEAFDPELRQAAEAVLQEGETLSSFVEQSVRMQVERRRQQEAFIGAPGV